MHGYTDKEVAEYLKKPLWTVKTHKKHIFLKLGISTTHEMVIYCITQFLEMEWDLDLLRQQGLAIFLYSK